VIDLHLASPPLGAIVVPFAGGDLGLRGIVMPCPYAVFADSGALWATKKHGASARRPKRVPCEQISGARNSRETEVLRMA